MRLLELAIIYFGNYLMRCTIWINMIVQIQINQQNFQFEFNPNEGPTGISYKGHTKKVPTLICHLSAGWIKKHTQEFSYPTKFLEQSGSNFT